jgi:hypothetical protein
MKRRAGPRNADLIHGAEALDVLNQTAKFARQFSLSPGNAGYFFSAAGLLMPPRKDEPPPDLRSFQPLAEMIKANWSASAA